MINNYSSCLYGKKWQSRGNVDRDKINNLEKCRKRKGNKLFKSTRMRKGILNMRTMPVNQEIN